MPTYRRNPPHDYQKRNKKNDLFDALRKDEIAGAALDVIEDEPLKTKKEAQTPNLIVTCHSGFYSVQAAWEMRFKAAAQARDLIVGEDIENCINCRFLPRNFINNLDKLPPEGCSGGHY